MEEGEGIEPNNGVNLLPEVIIQHIQSFLTSKEAGRTATLSKSFRSAWLTRPNLDFDQTNFACRNIFWEFLNQTIQRYRDLKLKIESISLRTNYVDNFFFVEAMKIGPTDINLQFFHLLDLPEEVLACETLDTLSLSLCRIGVGKINCSNLKSLTLVYVFESDDGIKELLLNCPFLEKLSLSSGSFEYQLSPLLSQCQFQNLNSLFLSFVEIPAYFFNEFSCRFPILKEMVVDSCYINQKIRIASPSLEQVRFIGSISLPAKLDFPAIRKFEFSGITLPTLSLKTLSSEWECHISIKLCAYTRRSQFLNPLRSILRKTSRSCKFFLSLTSYPMDPTNIAHEGKRPCVKPLPQVRVEDLTIDLSSTFCPDHLRGLVKMICKPKVINLSSEDGGLLEIVCSRLIYGRYLPLKVEVDYFDEDLNLWQSLPYETLVSAFLGGRLHLWPAVVRHGERINPRVRFQLRWA